MTRLAGKRTNGKLSARFSTKTRALFRAALREDIGRRDLTSELIVSPSVRGEAVILARDKGIFCGSPVLRELSRIVDPGLKLSFCADDGKSIRKNQVVVRLKGRVRSILKVERTALNFIGRLSGIATLTYAFVKTVKRYPVLILDTRKTTPLWREAEKYAVRAGGGKNHRMGLYDAVFVKENHRRYGNLSRLKKYRGQFEIEVRNLRELHSALKAEPRVILFDNFKPALLRRGVRIARNIFPQIILEASGGITLENISHYATMGIDWISIGTLTHSVKSLDFSLLVR